MNLILLLCKDYNKNTHRFCHFLNEHLKISAKMIVDNNAKDYSQLYPNEIIQISDDKCIESGFINSFSGLTDALIKKNPIAFDKAIYFLSELNFDKAFIIEYDCLVMNPKIFQYYFCTEFDLLVPQHTPRLNNSLDWHWRSIEKSIDAPYFFSMVCCVGVSKKMIDKVVEHKQKIGSLFYAEAMLNTIAHQQNLIIKIPKQFSSIVAMADWSESYFVNFPNNIFHPVKDIEKHNFYRFLKVVTIKYCLSVQCRVICPQPYQKQMFPKFLKR
jgi:hypothetical protein